MKKLFLILAPALGLTGCVAVAAGVIIAAAAVGTYKYVENELHRDYQAAYDQAWEAAQRTPKDLGFHAVSAARDNLKGVIESRRADETPVRIVVEKVDDKTVHIAVRVGTFESEENRKAAEAVHEQIYRNMGGKP